MICYAVVLFKSFEAFDRIVHLVALVDCFKIINPTWVGTLHTPVRVGGGLLDPPPPLLNAILLGPMGLKFVV